MGMLKVFGKTLLPTLFGAVINGLIVYAIFDFGFWASALCGYLMSELISSAGTIKNLKEELSSVTHRLGRIEERMQRNQSRE